ncbi:MAG TPA: serine/threonine-protein kinase [Steroidobacteraceae bacterium]|nr:serine/threonine-protein kinase [Steroidobacteraceae bacterium]
MTGAGWEAVSALLDELLDLDDAQRAARLAQVRLRDPALGDKVAGLLARQAAVQMEQFLEGNVVDPLGLSELAGRSFGGYTLERPLGQGGMGSVWLARRSDGRYEGQAAVKLLNLGALGHGGAERLRHEANALAKLSHPNITHLIDAGVAAAQPYLVMEYVEGEPIDIWCDGQSLDVDARVRLFLQVLDAVGHAHGRLLLHRDLKPSNILVTKSGSVKLLDFGIAKLLEGDGQSTQPSYLTRLGGSAMTPEYAAPEQMQHAEVTTATDVYALGVLLYVLLVGRHPTAGETSTPVEQMQALIDAEPQRLSDAALDADTGRLRIGSMSAAHLARALRGDLDNIIAKALQKEPADRYATADAFASDLKRYLNHEPVSARPESRTYRMRKFVRRHRLAVGAVATIALVLVAGIAGTTWQAIEASRQRAQATAQARESARQRDAAQFQAQRAEASSEFMSLMLEEVGPGGTPLTPLELVDRGVQLLERRYGEDQPFAARMLLQMARRYMDLGNTDKQGQVLARALAIARNQNDADLLADVECTIVRTEIDAGRYDLAEQHMQSARTALARATAEVATRVDCLRAEAEVEDARQEIEAAIAHLRSAQQLLEETQNTRGLQYHAVLTDLGGMYFRTSRFREALELNDRTARALDENGRGGTLGRVRTAINRASVLLRLGEVQLAEEATRDAMRRAQRLDEDKPTQPDQVVAYSIILNRLGRTDESIARLTAASRELHASRSTTRALSADYHLARALMLEGRYDESTKLLDAVAKAWNENPKANKDRLADLTRTRAELELARHRLDAARSLIDASLRQFGYPSAAIPLGLTAALTTAARVHLARGELTEAEPLAAAALRISQGLARNPAQSADVGEAALALALLQRAQGDPAAARGSADRAIEALTSGLGRDHASTREALALRAALQK